MTIATCARRSAGSGRAMRTSTIHVSAPRANCSDNVACVSTASRTARYLAIELVVGDQPELHRGSRHALLEVHCVEAEPVAEELDDVVLARHVVRFRHEPRIPPPFTLRP